MKNISFKLSGVFFEVVRLSPGIHWSCQRTCDESEQQESVLAVASPTEVMVNF